MESADKGKKEKRGGRRDRNIQRKVGAHLVKNNDKERRRGEGISGKNVEKSLKKKEVSLILIC